jgi:hypothetical protein
MSVTPSDFYLTIPEFLERIVAPDDYLSRVDLSADASVAAVNGFQVIVVDTTGGVVTVTLEAANAAPPKYSPIVINVGTNDVVVDAAINGIIDPTIATQFGGLAIMNNGGEYVASLKVQP